MGGEDGAAMPPFQTRKTKLQPQREEKPSKTRRTFDSTKAAKKEEDRITSKLREVKGTGGVPRPVQARFPTNLGRGVEERDGAAEELNGGVPKRGHGGVPISAAWEGGG